MQWHQCAFFSAIITLSLIIDDVVTGFGVPTSPLCRIPWSNQKSSTSLSAYPPRKNRANAENKIEDDDVNVEDPLLESSVGRQGDDRNWIEESPSSQASEDDDGIIYFDLGINGETFQTGQLSERTYRTLESAALKKFPADTKSLPPELDAVYKMYSMDITAKEAAKVTLEQNGLSFVNLSGDDGAMQDIGEWGVIDSVALFDVETGGLQKNGGTLYDNLQLAVEEGGWIPGQGFDFVVKNVPTRLKDMDVADIMKALDPDGSLRAEAKEKGMTLPDEEISSLQELGNDSNRRAKVVPREVSSDDTVYTGDGSKGYNIIQRSDLICESSQNEIRYSSLMHVMDALVNHGCLIVDLADGGTSYKDVIKVMKMWETTNSFFEDVNESEGVAESLPPIGLAEGAGSPHAMVGFADYGTMQFLETRIKRDQSGGGVIEPKELEGIIKEGGVSAMKDAFDVICNVGKDVVKTSVTAASVEYDAFLDDCNGSSLRAATLMVDELIDDGTSRTSNEEQASVSMTPHRLCRYTSSKTNSKPTESSVEENFGAHADTSYVTIIPVAGVNGLEVFDEAADCWLRPELLARKVWEMEQVKLGQDPKAQTEEVTVVSKDGKNTILRIPWHCRYLVVMPGELLQVCTRNEVPAAIHRVVSVKNGSSRMSTPVLLRSRTGMRMDVTKYFGQLEMAGPLLYSCEGMKMEKIHDGLQPSSYK